MTDTRTRAFVNGDRPTIALDMDGTLFDWSTWFAEILLARGEHVPQEHALQQRD